VRHVPTVYCFTGSMTTIRALWHQRIKWQSGTIGDLINFGFNRLNWREWMQQGFGLICVVFWVLWLTYNGAEVAHGHLIPNWSWLFYPAIFSVVESVHAWRIHGRDWKDMLLAATLIKALAYTWISMAWILASWWVILRGSTKDLWNAQYVAEGMEGKMTPERAVVPRRRRRPISAALSLLLLMVLGIAGWSAAGAGISPPRPAAYQPPVRAYQGRYATAGNIPVLVYHEMNNGCRAVAATCRSADPESVSTAQFTAR